MKKSIVILLAFALIGVILYSQRLSIVSGVMEKGLELHLFADRTAELEDGLHLALCGAGGPLPAPKASGPCVAVVAGNRWFMESVCVFHGSCHLLVRADCRYRASFIT